MSEDKAAGVLGALIVGCGAIAGGYDENSPADDGIRTHAGAYNDHRGFKIVACIEPDEARRQAFMAHWGIARGFPSVEAYARSDVRAEVASVCVPSAGHESVLTALLELDVRAVLCEKPLCSDLAAARRLVAAYRDAGVGLLVNYLRRWVPGIADLREDVLAGRWGALQGARGDYTKGILNCGTHMVDLLHFLVGPVTARAVLHRREGPSFDDPTLDVLLEGAGEVPVYLLASDHRHFFNFELELTFEKGRVTLEDLGRAVRVRTLEEDREFPERRTLERGIWTETGLGEAMRGAVDNLYAHVRDGASPACDGAAALAAETVCHRLIAMAREEKFLGKEG